MFRKISIYDIAELNNSNITKDDNFTYINYLDTGNITKNKIDTLQLLEINKDKIPSRAKRKVKQKTIIYSTVRPNQEHYGFIDETIDNLIVSTGFTTIDCINSNIDAKFLYYYLSQGHIVEYFQGIAENSVSSYPSMKPEDIGNLYINVPTDIYEQQKIAYILSTLDKKIELNNQINQNLEAMAKTLYDYWFVQFDFPNANGKPYKSSGGKMVYSEELKREIPEGWEVKELKHITGVSNDSLNPMLEPDKNFKHYSIPVFDETKTYAIEKGKTIKSNKFIIGENDILVSKLNPKFNRVVYPIDEKDLISSTEFVVWRADNKAIKNYLYIVAKHEHFISFCMQSASGTSNSHKRINPTVMMDYKVVFHKDIANIFGTKIHPMLKKIIENQKETQKLTQLRDWLLPMLMNGQVSVNVATEQVEELMVAEPKQGYGV